MMPSIKEQLSKKIEKIEQTIDFYLPEEKGLQTKIYRQQRHCRFLQENQEFMV